MRWSGSVGVPLMAIGTLGVGRFKFQVAAPTTSGCGRFKFKVKYRFTQPLDTLNLKRPFPAVRRDGLKLETANAGRWSIDCRLYTAE